MSHKLQPGINHCTNAEYHSDKEYLSSSKLKTLLESPAKFYKELTEPPEPMTGAHLDLGTYVHALLLEPDLVAEEYRTFPGFRRAGKDYELFKAQWPDKQIISASMENNGQRLAASAKACPPALELLKNGLAELSIAAVLDDVQVKARFDYIRPTEGMIIDLKTSRDPAGKQYFKDTIAQYQYDLSAALYMQIAEQFYGRPFDFYWIVISKTDVPECRVYKASAKTMQAGRHKVSQALEVYKQCKKTGLWLDNAPKSATIQETIEEI